MSVRAAGLSRAAGEESFGLLIGDQWVRRPRTILITNALGDRRVVKVLPESELGNGCGYHRA